MLEQFFDAADVEIMRSIAEDKKSLKDHPDLYNRLHCFFLPEIIGKISDFSPGIPHDWIGDILGEEFETKWLISEEAK